MKSRLLCLSALFFLTSISVFFAQSKPVQSEIQIFSGKLTKQLWETDLAKGDKSFFRLFFSEVQRRWPMDVATWGLSYLTVVEFDHPGFNRLDLGPAGEGHWMLIISAEPPKFINNTIRVAGRAGMFPVYRTAGYFNEKTDYPEENTPLAVDFRTEHVVYAHWGKKFVVGTYNLAHDETMRVRYIYIYQVAPELEDILACQLKYGTTCQARVPKPPKPTP